MWWNLSDLQESGTVFVRFSEDGLASLNHTTANLFHPWIWAVLLLSYFDILAAYVIWHWGLDEYRRRLHHPSPRWHQADDWKVTKGGPDAFSKWLDIREAKVATLASHSSVESVGSCLTEQDNKGPSNVARQVALLFSPRPCSTRWTWDPCGGPWLALCTSREISRKHHPARNYALPLAVQFGVPLVLVPQPATSAENVLKGGCSRIAIILPLRNITSHIRSSDPFNMQWT